MGTSLTGKKRKDTYTWLLQMQGDGTTLDAVTPTTLCFGDGTETPVSITTTGLFVGGVAVSLAGHTHTAAAISDSTAAGRALLVAATSAAQRTAMGAAATSHTHSTSNITGLDAALAAKIGYKVGTSPGDLTGPQQNSNWILQSGNEVWFWVANTGALLLTEPAAAGPSAITATPVVFDSGSPYTIGDVTVTLPAGSYTVQFNNTNTTEAIGIEFLLSISGDPGAYFDVTVDNTAYTDGYGTWQLDIWPGFPSSDLTATLVLAGESVITLGGHMMSPADTADVVITFTPN